MKLIISMLVIALIGWKLIGVQESSSTIDANTLAAKINDEEKLLIIDVREIEEFNSGHIENAISIPLSRVKLWPEELAKELSSTETVIVVCRSGHRSKEAQQVLIDKGIKNVLNLSGGMLSWKGKIIRER